jgi:AcrR family transcriptional regulator
MATADRDLTAAARIRDAALRQFAARGVAATSIRDVARAARVSPGLVQHHFRSKDGLRRAVEEFVVQRATETFGQPISAESPAEISTKIGSKISAFIRANPAMFAFIGRSLLEGDTAGMDLFAGLLRLARAQVELIARAGLLRPDLDLEWTALHVILIDVGAYLLEPGLSRYLGRSLLAEGSLERMETATAALFLRGVFRAEKRRRQAPRVTRRSGARRSRRRRTRP